MNCSLNTRTNYKVISTTVWTRQTKWPNHVRKIQYQEVAVKLWQMWESKSYPIVLKWRAESHCRQTIHLLWIKKCVITKENSPWTSNQLLNLINQILIISQMIIQPHPRKVKLGQEHQQLFLNRKLVTNIY